MSKGTRIFSTMIDPEDLNLLTIWANALNAANGNIRLTEHDLIRQAVAHYLHEITERRINPAVDYFQCYVCEKIRRVGPFDPTHTRDDKGRPIIICSNCAGI